MTPFLNNLGYTTAVDVTAHALRVLFQYRYQSPLYSFYTQEASYSIFLKGSLHEEKEDFKRQKAECCLAI